MKGLTIDPTAGLVEVVDGARTTFTTAGDMICAAPVSAVNISGQTLVLPDFDKAIAYYHSYTVHITTSGGHSVWQNSETAISWVTAVPQEYSLKIALADAPAEADFFAGRIKLSRTGDPADGWMGRTIACVIAEDVWIPAMGGCSLLLEQDIGMVRGAHLYLDKAAFLPDGVTANPTLNKLVLEAQQSVSVATGGYGSDLHPATYNSIIDVGTDGHGAAFTAIGSAAGIAIKQIDGKTTSFPNTSTFASQPNLYNFNGGSPVSTTDATDYESTYSIDVVGRFARRS